MSGLLDSVSQALVSVGRLCKVGAQQEREPDEDELMVLRKYSVVQQPYDTTLHEPYLRAIHEAFHGTDKHFMAVSTNWRMAGFRATTR